MFGSIAENPMMEPSYSFVPRFLSGESSWIGHIPFAYDLVRFLRPSLLVELGTWNGDSFFAFCQSVADHALSTRCYAVDHWKGDDQAGQPSDAQFERVQAYCSATYPVFAYLMRTDFASASSEFNDQTIDLLHIDGMHTYDAVSGDFATWFPKVRSGGVILFHDTCVRSSEEHPDFGVWKLWDELKGQHRTFEFSHAYGLGILIKNDNPEIEAWLHAASETSLSDYYSWRGTDLVAIACGRKACGQRDEFAAQLQDALAKQRLSAIECDSLRNERDALRDERDALRDERDALRDERDALRDERDALRDERDTLRDERNALRNERDALRRQIIQSGERIAKLDSDVEHLKVTRFEAKRECHSIKTSLSWRLTWPLRVLRDASAAFLNQLKRRRNLSLTAQMHVSSTAERAIAAIESTERRPSPSPNLDAERSLVQNPHLPASNANELASFWTPGRHRGRKIAFISGEPQTPGHTYRVRMHAEALAKAGADVRVLRVDELADNQGYVEAADAVVIWRAAWCKEIESATSAARKSGTKIIFDVDDLMFDPALAKTDVIDGIRSQGFAESIVADFYGRMQTTMVAADFCICATRPLGTAMRGFQKPVFVLPNGFDEERYRRSRRAAADQAAAGSDGLIRIGYAAGSRTHQKDFACAVGAVARVLREHPECRLVLFRHESSAGNMNCLIPEEFPELDGLDGQIEWRGLVPVDDLPSELVRFDINLAPLEVGNPFCEAKSELKYFEAALVGVPTVASPTVPYAEAVKHEVTGFLATGAEEWYDAIKRLVMDPELRRRMGAEALFDVLWKFGPERRAELAAGILEQVVSGSAAAARVFELELRRTQLWRVPRIESAEFEIVFESGARAASEVAVVVPLYNYAGYVVEALESVKAQTIPQRELIVVDDCSTDHSLSVASDWLRNNAVEFTHVALLKNRENAGLALSRNTGFLFSDARFIMPLDADNTIEPRCLERCLEVINATGAAAAYPTIREFGDAGGLFSADHWKPTQFAGGNYIDAMALVRRAAWSAVGGYRRMQAMGWEDFEMWCRFIEHGFWGAWVSEPLASYRVHGTSMIQTVKYEVEKQRQLIAEVHELHPWLDVAALRRTWSEAAFAKKEQTAVGPGKSESGSIANISGTEPRPRSRQRLEEIVPLLRCPASGCKLRIESEQALVTEDGSRRWPLKRGRPIFFGSPEDVRVFPDTHLSNPIPVLAMKLIEEAQGPVLNMSAGGTRFWLPNVVELETALFRNTDIVGDGHALPFGDGVFDAVLAINAFEHYREPDKAVSEILRVLKPGGRVFIHTAFLQPLHEPPWHFFNCTKFGLLEWFSPFEIISLKYPRISIRSTRWHGRLTRCSPCFRRSAAPRPASGLGQCH